jgi:HEAT repeat protein
MTLINRLVLAVLFACPVFAVAEYGFSAPAPPKELGSLHPRRLRLALYPYLRGPLTEARVAAGRRLAGELASIEAKWEHAKTGAVERAKLKSRLSHIAAALKNVPAIRMNPYDAQIAANLQSAKAGKIPRRIRAIEALGYLRAYRCAGAVAGLMGDKSADVRRQVVQTLAWIGGRAEVSVLLGALSDSDWSVRQGACAALQNLTGMELPLDALGGDEMQRKQIGAWRAWWKSVPAGKTPEVLVKLAGSDDLDERLRAVRALGSLGGAGASELVIKILRAGEPDKTAIRDLVNAFAPAAKRDQTPFTIMQAGLRSLGRLRDPKGLVALREYLNKVQFARYAADGLGEYGGAEAAGALLDVADRYVPGLKGRFQRASDDVEWPANPLSTAFAIYSALLRLPVEGENLIRLVQVAHGAPGQVRKQYDRGVFYKPEAARVVGRYILEMTGLRRLCMQRVFEILKVTGKSDDLPSLPKQLQRLANSYRDELLPGFCDRSDAPALIRLLENPSNRVRIMACKALSFAGATEAVEPIAKLLVASKSEADYGFVRDFLLDPHRDPSGRWRGTFARALGALGANDQVPLLAKIMNDSRSVLDVRYAAARALADLDTPEAIAALKPAAKSHDFHNIRLLAREVLFRHGVKPEPVTTARLKPPAKIAAVTTGLGPAVVFIKGSHIMPDYYLTDIWRQTYCLTDSGGPEYRVGDNLFVLRPARPDGKLTPLTKFTDGWVASCEVSYDGKKVLFTRRAEDNPWWQVFEIGADGSGMRQLTTGPYHHLNPAYLPDGRIVLATTRLGFRDEYHGQQCSALAVMNADGSDIHLIAANAGRDCEPTVMPDGRILFNRLDVFYNMTKAEMTIQSVFPDGTGNETLYGPERRAFWAKKFGPKTENWYEHPFSWMHDRHRVVTVTQPQPLGSTGEIVACSGLGLIAFKTRFSERFCHKTDMALTTPFPIDDHRFLCAASERHSPYVKPRGQWYDSRLRPGDPEVIKRIQMRDPQRTLDRRLLRYSPELLKKLKADLGLHVFDAKTGKFKLVYNDPETADFEARPLAARRRPPIHHDRVTRGAFTGRILCQSVFNSQAKRVGQRAKWIRIIEGQPLVHKFMRNDDGRPRSSHNFDPELRNHQGTLGRVLGTAPLAADGSFALEVPADRLIQCQALDADRQVVGNQIQWIYVRPGENRGCVGCHNKPETAPVPKARPRAMLTAPLRILPIGYEFEYEARPWRRNDPIVLDSIEERLRTVLSLEMLGRQ